MSLAFWAHMNVDRPAPFWKDPPLTSRPQDLDFRCEHESWPRPVAAVPTDVSLWLSVSLPPKRGHSGQDCSGEWEELHCADQQGEWPAAASKGEGQGDRGFRNGRE